MKKTLFIIFSLGLGLGIVLAVMLREPSAQFDQEAKRLVCMIPPETGYYWGGVREGIAAADQDLGTYTRIEPYSRYEESSHAGLLDHTAYYHVDGIITVGEPYSEEIRDSIRACVERGIPVALIDTDDPESGRSVYIGTDNEKAGEDAAKKLLEFTGGSVKAAVIITGISDANQNERLKGFRRVIDQDPESEVLVVYENRDDKSGMASFLTNAIQSRPTLNAIFCAEASTTNTVGIFLKSLQTDRELYVIGFDEVAPVPQLVVDGVLSGTMIQQNRQMGYNAVRFLLDYIEDPQKAPEINYTPAVFTGPEEAKAFLE